MVLAIIGGVLCGLLGYLPLWWAQKQAKKMVAGGMFAQMGTLILCLVISFVLMAAVAIGVALMDKSLALPFVLAEAGAFSVAAIAYGIYNRPRDKDER